MGAVISLAEKNSARLKIDRACSRGVVERDISRFALQPFGFKHPVGATDPHVRATDLFTRALSVGALWTLSTYAYWNALLLHGLNVSRVLLAAHQPMSGERGEKCVKREGI